MQAAAPAGCMAGRALHGGLLATGVPGQAIAWQCLWQGWGAIVSGLFILPTPSPQPAPCPACTAPPVGALPARRAQTGRKASGDFARAFDKDWVRIGLRKGGTGRG